MVLKLERYVAMPPHTGGGFDHGDVYLSNGFVYVAHTANGTVEVVDGLKGYAPEDDTGLPRGEWCGLRSG